MAEPRHIAVNTRLLLPHGLEGIGRVQYEVLQRLALRHPDTQFSFFFDRAFDPKYIFAPNVKGYALFPPARHSLLFLAFFEWAVPRMLRKLKPDLFFSPDGYLSLRARIPQVPVFHDLSFEHYPQDVAWQFRKHYHYFFPRYARKAAHILTVSDYTRQDVVQQYGISPDKITVAWNGVSELFSPVTAAQQQAMRDKYTDGQRYFHCVGAIQPRKNLITLIRAFDRYKSDTGSPDKLLVIGRKAWNFEDVITSYQESPYRADIVFTGFVEDAALNALYSASEALCYVPYFEGFGIPLLEAMKAGTAVISSNRSSMPEVTGEAALLVDPMDAGAIAAAMRRVREEPGLRDELIRRGAARAALFSWDKTADIVWEVLCKAIS